MGGGGGGGIKTTGLLNTPDYTDELLSPFESDSDDDIATDLEVSKYSFLNRLKHYMNGERISSENRKAIEFAILFEAGTAVRNMDCMRKEMLEKEIYVKYTKLIEEIEDTEFDSEGVRAEMLSGYKGPKKGLTVLSLQQKLKADSAELKKFSYGFPGIKDPSKLPSGTAQVSQMKGPYIALLWKKVNPVRSF